MIARTHIYTYTLDFDENTHADCKKKKVETIFPTTTIAQKSSRWIECRQKCPHKLAGFSRNKLKICFQARSYRRVYALISSAKVYFLRLVTTNHFTLSVTRKSRRCSLNVVRSIPAFNNPATNPATCALVRLGKDDRSKFPTKSATYCRLLCRTEAKTHTRTSDRKTEWIHEGKKQVVGINARYVLHVCRCTCV